MFVVYKLVVRYKHYALMHKTETNCLGSVGIANRWSLFAAMYKVLAELRRRKLNIGRGKLHHSKNCLHTQMVFKAFSVCSKRISSFWKYENIFDAFIKTKVIMDIVIIHVAGNAIDKHWPITFGFVVPSV